MRYLIFILCIFGVAYYVLNYTYKKPIVVLDTSKYTKTIDSLNLEIAKNYDKLQTLDSIVVVQNKKIVLIENKMYQVKLRAEKQKQDYEQERIRISNLSDDKLIREFTKTFR